MAKIYPEDENRIHFNSGTEKTMYEAFRDQLPDKDTVFYSVSWNDENNKGNMEESEADFVIVDPSFGFLVTEVKGGYDIEVDNGKWYLILDRYDHDNKRYLGEGPYKQAEKSMYHFKDLFEKEYGQTLSMVYGRAVAFPLYQKNEPLATDAPLEITICKDDLKRLNDKINSIFHYWGRTKTGHTPPSKAQTDKFIECINKHIALTAAAGALIEEKEDEFARIDFVQDSILDTLYNYPQACIEGGAGTGKTFIAIKKAIREAKAGKKVLFLCCGESLLRFVKHKAQELSQADIDFKTYEQLITEVIGKEACESIKPNENGNRICEDLWGNVPYDKQYDAIMVDEAQDFDSDMGLTLKSFLKDEHNSTLYVFYDVNQNLYNYKDNADNAFEIENKPFLLRYNIRNTASIYDYAVKETGLGKDTIANDMAGVKPDVRYNKSKNLTQSELTNIVNDLLEEGVSSRSMVVLSDEPFEQSVLAGETYIGPLKISTNPIDEIKDNEICFQTAKEFKGQESDVVIYLTKDDENDPDILRDATYMAKKYVALTRARYFLYVLITGKK